MRAAELFERVKLLQPLEVREKGLRLEVLDQSGAAEIGADPDLLGQALLGLVTNAAQAAPERGSVTLEARSTGDEITLSVSDDGPGVPEADRERIFEPFYSTRRDGHGLGLAVVRQIARAHGARIEVGEGEAGGARFSIVFPARVAASPRGAEGSLGRFPMKARVLIVDDEPRMAASLRTALERSGFECECAGNGAEALLALEARRADVVVSDRRMPVMDGLELLREVKARYGELPFVMMTAYADVPSAVEAMRAGAFDYVAKPFDNDEIRAQVARAVELVRLKRENAWLRQETAAYTPESMIAESAASRGLLELVRRVARASSSVLVQGESGTGKEFVARLLHYWSDRVGAPFVAVNCAALAPGVLESELFGHERGAFTGALQARAGCFERAHGGTLFLDEIGEISTDFQAKLLRVLQDGEVQRVGASKTRHVDVRVVAATNRNLRDAIAAGRFREDLYFRLNVIPIAIEPLRARREDILPLARFFLARHAERPLALSAEAEARLHRHDWPGNVRELENAIERGVILARGESVEPEDLLLEPAVERRSVRLPARRERSGSKRTREHAGRAGALAFARRLPATRRNTAATRSIAPPRSGCAARCARPPAAAPRPRACSASSARRSTV